MVYNAGDHAKVARNVLNSFRMSNTLEAYPYTQEIMSLVSDALSGSLQAVPLGVQNKLKPY